MSETSIQQLHTGHSSTVVRRMTVSLCLFTVVLASLLTLSKHYLLPQLTEVEVAGRVRNMQELQQYEQKLTADLLTAEQDRNQLVLPIQDELYLTLKTRKHEQRRLLSVQAEVAEVVKQFMDADKPTVLIHRLSINDQTGVVEVHGDVRNFGPRSMTVLAQLVDALRDAPSVIRVNHPRFLREEDPDIGPHSPFVLTIILS